MKRTLIFLLSVALLSGCAALFGPSVSQAERDVDRGNLIEAKETLDQAVEEDESIKEDADYWLVKGRLYLQIAIAEEEEYRQLADNPVEKGDEAIQKAEELDEEGMLLLELQQAKLLISEVVFNAGVEAYNEENWEDASTYFLRAFELEEEFTAEEEEVDYSTLYNAALTAELSQDFEQAKPLYLKLREEEHDEPYIYSSLSNISMELGDTTQATEYIQEGRERYPENLDLIFNEANIHIVTGDTEQAEEVLNIAIEREPDNPGLYFALGANYDKMAEDDSYTDEEREFAFEQAVEAYEKAIELDPEYFDAVYNLGVLHFNKGLRIFEEAEEELRETQDFAQYQETEEEFKEVWLQAQPYLERAKEMIDEDDPSYRNVIISLVELYARTDQRDKLEEIQEIYEKYFGEEEER